MHAAHASALTCVTTACFSAMQGRALAADPHTAPCSHRGAWTPMRVRAMLALRHSCKMQLCGCHEWCWQLTYVAIRLLGSCNSTAGSCREPACSRARQCCQCQLQHLKPPLLLLLQGMLCGRQLQTICAALAARNKQILPPTRQTTAGSRAKAYNDHPETHARTSCRVLIVKRHPPLEACAHHNRIALAATAAAQHTVRAQAAASATPGLPGKQRHTQAMPVATPPDHER